MTEKAGNHSSSQRLMAEKAVTRDGLMSLVESAAGG